MPKSTIALLGVFASLGALFPFFQSGGSVKVRVPLVAQQEAPIPDRPLTTPAPAQDSVTDRPAPQRRSLERLEQAWFLDDLGADYRRGAASSPADRAEAAYEDTWRETVEDMQLENEAAVRTILVGWQQFNIELDAALMAGDISIEDFAENVLSRSALWDRLAPHLTSDQITDLQTTIDLRDEYVRHELCRTLGVSYFGGDEDACPE